MKTKITFSILFFLSICTLAQEVEIYETFDAFEQSIMDNCATTDLTYEDFSGILETGCGVFVIPDPDQTCFGQDELQDGFTFQGRNPAGENIGIIAGQQGEFGNSPINFVTPNNIFGTAIIDFDPPVEAVSFSLWGFLNNTGSTEVTLFNDNQEIIEVFDLDTPNSELYFFSTISTTPIARVITTNPDEGQNEGETGGGGSLIGELYFGAMGCTNLNTESFVFDEVTLYPNPVENLITVTNPDNIKFSEAIIFDDLGRVIKTYTITNNTIDVSNLESGLYLLELSNDQGKTTKKIVKK